MDNFFFNERSVSVDILISFDQHKSLDFSISDELDPRERGQVREYVQNILRKRSYLDFLIDYYATIDVTEMKTDLNSFDVKSPVNGVLFYGMNKDGKWLTSAAVAKKLVPGGKLTPHEVFMTVIEHGALNLVASVPEAKLANLKEGIDTHITPVSNPALSLRGKVQKVSRVPGAYRLTASVDSDNHNLLPGMAAKLKINAANYDKAITVPNNLINGDTVKVLFNGEKIDKKIKKGPSDGKVTVILEGISEGEKIVAH